MGREASDLGAVLHKSLCFNLVSLSLHPALFQELLLVFLFPLFLFFSHEMLLYLCQLAVLFPCHHRNIQTAVLISGKWRRGCMLQWSPYILFLSLGDHPRTRPNTRPQSWRITLRIAMAKFSSQSRSVCAAVPCFPSPCSSYPVVALVDGWPEGYLCLVGSNHVSYGHSMLRHHYCGPNLCSASGKRTLFSFTVSTWTSMSNPSKYDFVPSSF